MKCVAMRLSVGPWQTIRPRLVTTAHLLVMGTAKALKAHGRRARNSAALQTTYGVRLAFCRTTKFPVVGSGS